MEELQFFVDNIYIYVLVLARISGIIFFNPVISKTNIPAMIRTALVLCVTVLITPAIQIPADYNPGTFDFLLNFIKEIFVGFLLGYVFNIFYYMLLAVGDILDMNMGFGMAKVFDPATNMQSATASHLLHLLFMLYFFVTDSHLTLIGVAVSSFDIVPVGMEGFSVMGATSFAIDLFGSIFSLAMKLAIPFIAAELILEISLGILMKLIPQIHVFVINFQLKILLAIVLLFVLASPIGTFVDNYIILLFDELKNALNSLTVNG